MIINIVGGLGNQMFQFAFAYALSHRNNEILSLDLSNYDNNELRNYELGRFNIEARIASFQEVVNIKYIRENILEKVTRKIRGAPPVCSKYYYKEPHFNYDKKSLTTGPGFYFEGYWQSEKYFSRHRDELLEQFTLKDCIHTQSLKYEQSIDRTEAVSIHIRRGDYISDLQTNSVHGVCSLEYYHKAARQVLNKVGDAHFFIFSDDLDWAKEHINFIDNLTFVELGDHVQDHEEMYLMSRCKHNIIANSSFSWWGAWLNQYRRKMVYAPEKWFLTGDFDTRDLIPSGWTIL